MASPLDKPKGNEKPTTIQPTNQLLDKRRRSFPNIDSVHLKEKVNHLGTGVNDLDVRVQKLENSSPDGKLQKELEQSKQEVRNLKEELLIVRQELEKITAQSEKDQEQLLEKIQHLEKELEEKKEIIRRLEEEMGSVKKDLKTTKADLKKTADVSHANKKELASTKKDLATTKNELGKHTADIEFLKQAFVDMQRTTGASRPIQCTETPPYSAAAQATVESGQRGQQQTKREQPSIQGQHPAPTNLYTNQQERVEQPAGQNPPAQPQTPRQHLRSNIFLVPNPAEKPMNFMPGKK